MIKQLKLAVDQLKPVRFMGSSRRTIKEFPQRARQLAGLELFRIQEGEMPIDWKPMSTVSSGVYEIRIHEPTEHRVVYVAKFPEAIYVLHAFEKKTHKTPQREIETARKYYAEVQKERQN